MGTLFLNIELSERNNWMLILVLLLLLLSHFSRVRLCVTPEMAAHQDLPSLGFSRQEHWSGLPFPSPMHENEKWKWSRSVVSNSLWSHGLQSTRFLCPWDFPGKSTGVGCHFLLHLKSLGRTKAHLILNENVKVGIRVLLMKKLRLREFK